LHLVTPRFSVVRDGDVKISAPFSVSWLRNVVLRADPARAIRPEGQIKDREAVFAANFQPT
jgi:hypothetical protein